MNCAILNSELPWGLQRLGIQNCWQQGLTGAGVRVGHLDTGVDGSHPALRGRVVEFVEFDSDGYPVPQAQVRTRAAMARTPQGSSTAGLASRCTLALPPKLSCARG